MIRKVWLLTTVLLVGGFIAACSSPQPNSEYRETATTSEIISPTKTQYSLVLSSTEHPNTVTPAAAEGSPSASQTPNPVTPTPVAARLTNVADTSVWWEKLLPGQYLLYWVFDEPKQYSLYATSYDGAHEVRLGAGVADLGVISADLTMLLYITPNAFSGIQS